MSITSRDDTSIGTDRTRGQIQADNTVPHPRHAAGSIGVKFCAAPAMLLAPREVCASAVSAADPANSNAIARVSETLRISLLLRFSGMCPTWQCRDRPFYRARSLGPREYRELSV